MFRMLHSRFWVAAGLIALAVIIGFAFSVPHTRDGKVQKKPAPVATTTPVVTLSDSYRKGTHTLSGSVMAPDACMSVSADASLFGAASSTATTTQSVATTSERIELSLVMPADDGVCLQIPTKTDFSTTIDAPEGLPIDVTLNGQPASTTAP